MCFALVWNVFVGLWEKNRKHYLFNYYNYFLLKNNQRVSLID